MSKMERFGPIFLISGIGFFLISFLGMGIAPWTTLKNVIPPPELVTRTDLEKKGRDIFMKEACWHCHSQFVRPVAGEPLRYGPVSTAAEHINEIPQLFGTRRVGPDLAREAGKRSDDWHFSHFYNPRTTVPWSIMPSFPWLFEEKDGQIIPKEDAKALVAYVQSIGRNVQPIMDKEKTEFAKNFKTGPAPQVTSELLGRGRELFLRECTGCHGKAADGQSVAQSFLKPIAADLTTVNPTPEYLFKVLNLGIPGSAMPSFHEYKPQDLWAIAHYVATLNPEHERLPGIAPDATPELIAKGQTIYQQVCFICHGAEGRGDGAAGVALKPSPPDFHGLRPQLGHIVNVMEHGVAGTAMAPFALYPLEDKWAVAYYIQSLVDGHE